MPPRASWKGYLRLSLVAVPVQAFNAASSDGGEIHFHQLHAECHNRIRYQKQCPVHGEVPNNEIVRGYEYEKGKYVIVDEKEVDQFRTEADRAINIDTFVAPNSIDPMYFDGRTYYLVPDGAMATQPFTVLLQALEEKKRWAVGRALFFGREQLVMIRPQETVLCVEMLHYRDQVRLPADLGQEFVASPPTVKKEEVRLASKLIEASTRKKFDLGQYQDEYTAKLQKLIDAKIQGKQVVRPPQDDETPVINLMDALKKSVANATGGRTKKAAGETAAKPARRRRSSSRRTAS